MHRTTDSVRPRHHQAAAAHHSNVIPRRTTTTNVDNSDPTSNNSTEGGGRIHKRPAYSMRRQWWQRNMRRIVIILIAAPLIHFMLLTSVGSSSRGKSLWPLSSSHSSTIRKGTDPMQSFLSPPQGSRQQQQQANNDQVERQGKQEGQQQSSSSSSTFDNNVDAPPVGMFQGLPVTYHEVRSKNNRNSSSSKRLSSSVHCVGENFQTDNTAWMVRSCQFRNLCFDMNTKDFVIFQSAEEERLQQRLEKLQQRRYQRKQQERQTQCQQQIDSTSGKCQPSLDDPQQVVSIASLALQNHTKVSLGSLHDSLWKNPSDIDRLQWFPKIMPHSSMALHGYYQLPNDVVWVPFIHASSVMMNAGNLVWNDLFSIYTLLSMFDLLGNSDDNNKNKNKHRRLLLMRRVLEEPSLSSYNTCDFNATSLQHCRVLLEKFLPAMGIHPPLQFSTNLDYELTLFHQQKEQQQSHLICARYGAAGIGMLSSASAAAAHHHHHDNNNHQFPQMQRGEDTLLQLDYYKDTFNLGRGATLRAFGNYMASNLGIHNNNNDPPGNNDPGGDSSIQYSFTAAPYKIAISIDSSSRQYKRDMDHSIQIARIQKEFAGGSGVGDNDDDVVIQSFDVQQLTLVEQARIAAESAIFVSICGDGSVMAAFLSPGASLIIYNDNVEQEHKSEDSGTYHHQDLQQQQPARIDWDLLSNAGYFRTHWLPLQRNEHGWNIASLVDLMRHELDRIRYESSSTSRTQ